MNLFYQKKIIHSSKSSERISAVLSNAIGRLPFSGKDFYGKVEDGKFKLYTSDIGRSCVIFCGTITEKDNGCVIETEAKLHNRDALLAAMVLSGIISVISLISGLSSIISNGFSADAVNKLVVLPFMAAIFAFFHFDFSAKTKKLLSSWKNCCYKLPLLTFIQKSVDKLR